MPALPGRGRGPGGPKRPVPRFRRATTLASLARLSPHNLGGNLAADAVATRPMPDRLTEPADADPPTD